MAESRASAKTDRPSTADAITCNLKNDTMHLTRTLTALLCALLALPVMSQTKKSFTLDDLMSGGSNFWNLQPKNIFTTWWGNRLVETQLDSLIAISDAQGHTGKRETLFTLADANAALEAAQLSKTHSLYQVTFPDGKKTEALIQTSTASAIFDWKAKKITWSAPRAEQTQHFDFSTASRCAAYVKDWNLYVTTADGRTHTVSSDGTRELQYGLSVHRDEFGIFKGTFWSPSGRLLAFYRMDQTMVSDFPLVDIDHRVAKLAPEKYPMAGMTSHKVTVGIFDPATDKTVYLQAGDPTDRYFTNVSWSPDERTIYMIELPRSQDKAELVAYDVATGERKGVLYTERNEKYVHPMHGITFLPWDSSKFIYQSERDGYNHLYLFDTTGKELCQLTKGDFVVLNLLGFNEKKRSVIISSTESSPIRNNTYSVDVKTGKRSLLDGGKGVHRASLAPGGEYIVDRWSSPDVTRRIDLVATASGKAVNLLDAADPWADYNVPEITCGTLKAADGETDLYYRMVKPVDFDPGKKYPTVVYVYGGPGLRNVEEARNYWARGWEIYMAQKGYLLFILDNRGSCDRGFAFESCTFRHLGDEEMRDQMKGVEYLKTLPYVDADRLGVHGWSFGGFMTTNLMCSYPDVFKAGVAGGPVIDWKYYEVMYGERYMDTPDENPEGYAGSSLLGKAGNLKGRLQIIVGYNDPTCVLQHSLSFLRACEDAGTQPDYFVYPGQGHNMMGQDMVHLHERITRYFEDFLK